MIERALKGWARAAGHGLASAASAVYGAADAVGRGFRPPRCRPEAVHRILVIRLDLLGDVVNSLPAITALRECFPGAEITVLVLPSSEPLFQAVPGVDHVLGLDVHAFRRPAGWRSWRSAVETLRQLRAAAFDLCLCLHGRVPSALAALSGARWRVGYAGESYPGTLNLPVPGYRYHQPKHEVEYCLDLVRSLGLPAPSRRPRLVLEEAVRQAAHQLLERHGAAGPRPLVVAHAGSSNGRAKRWPTARWAAWADRVQQELGARVALTGTAADRPLTAEIAQQMRTRPLDLAGQTDLLTLAGLCAASAAVVSGDTGPLHLAVAAGARVVGLFGPTDPANYAPYAPDAVVLRHPVPCGPCYDLRGPADCRLPHRGLDCMWGLSVERVYRAVARLLADQG